MKTHTDTLTELRSTNTDDTGYAEERSEKLARDFVAAYCHALPERR